VGLEKCEYLQYTARLAGFRRNAEKSPGKYSMTQETAKSLRSYRWFGRDDLRSFGHRSRAASMGCIHADYAGKPVIGIINT